MTTNARGELEMSIHPDAKWLLENVTEWDKSFDYVRRHGENNWQFTQPPPGSSPLSGSMHFIEWLKGRMKLGLEPSGISEEDEESAIQEHYERLNKTIGDNKYSVKIKGVPVDVYDVLAAFNVTNPATAHAIKKQLKSGQRGHKDTVTDLREAIASLERAIELESKQ